ncbi:hypothetical protein H9P43_005155 [Blastocladiella emersonii ATCC 22665]|nr:hypothetical protein H9P43_005155 [Blastocladiella emersonii ATCC 22665]
MSGDTSGSTASGSAAKLARLEVDIGAARLRGDYAVALPALLKKWRKRMATQSTILEDVVQAEACLHARGPAAWTWAPVPSPDAGGAPDPHPPTTAKSAVAPEAATRLLADAAAAVTRAYATLLENHRLQPMSPASGTAQSPECADLPRPPASLDGVRALLSTSQLYLEILTLKAQILHHRGAHAACLAVLTTELDLPPAAPAGLQVRGIGLVYLAKALVMKVDCLHARGDETARREADETLRFLLHYFPSAADTDMFAAGEVPMPVSGPAVPFATPVPAAVFESAHMAPVLEHGLFLGGMRWIHGWMSRIVSDLRAAGGGDRVYAGSPGPLDDGSISATASSSMVGQNPPLAESSAASISSFPTLPAALANAVVLSTTPPDSDFLASLPFPVLTYQALDFVRAYFGYTPRASAGSTAVFAQWAVRFLVLWSHIVVQVGGTPNAGPIPDTLYVDYAPAPPAPVVWGSGWKAESIHDELEGLFRAWFRANATMVPFPTANEVGNPPSMANKLMEELAATLQWSDGLLGIKAFSIQMLETTIRHTFHSLLCHRVLAATHFRVGNTAEGLTLLRRQMELARASRRGAEAAAYPPTLYPATQAALVQLYDAMGLPRESMFVVRDDAADEFANLLVEGSMRLAEVGELDDAVEIARFAHAMVEGGSGVNRPSQAVVCAILDNLATVLGVSALSTFDYAKRDAQQTEAIALLTHSLSLSPTSPRAHFQLALLHADRGHLGPAKAHVKQTLKANKAHVAAWQLLVLILTASRDLDGAAKLAELGVRESIAALVPPTPTNAGVAKANTFEGLAALARDQRLNGTWAPAEYDQVVAAIFDLRLTQARIVEQVRGADAAIALVQELFRWYRVVFDSDVGHAGVAEAAAAAAASATVGARPGTSNTLSVATATGDDATRARSESVRSTVSAWSMSAAAAAAAGGSGGPAAPLMLRLKRGRKRTMLTAALANSSGGGGSNPNSVNGSVADPDELGASPTSRRSTESAATTNPAGLGDRPRVASIASVASLAASDADSLHSTSASAAAANLSPRRAEVQAKLWLRLAHVLHAAGQSGEARNVVREAALLRTGNADLAAELAALHYALGDADAAVAAWHTLLAADPHHLGALIGLARAQLDAGHLADAEVLLDDVTRHAGRNDTDAWYLYGRVCKAQRQPKRALACFRAALELERAEPIARFADVPRLSLVALL